MLRRSVMAAAIPALFACSSGDFDAQGVAKGFKANVDWVRDAFGQATVKLSDADPRLAYPAAPDDKRPLPRSLKTQTEMIAALKADHDNAGKIQAALAQSDPSKFLLVNGAKPTAQPVSLTFETIELPDGIRDIDSFDPSHAVQWFELGSVDFAETSSEPIDEEEEGLRRAAQLVKNQGVLRVVGYAASDHLTMGDKGPHEAARWLANQRARRIAARLVALGAPPRQLLVGAAPEAVRASGDKVEIIIDY